MNPAQREPEPLRLELHCHSDASRDCKTTPAHLIAALKTAGLGGLALTDHNSVANQSAVAELAEAQGLLFIPAVEVSSRQGHILAYGVAEAISKNLEADETRRLIHAAGGLAVAAHPLRPGTGVGRRVCEEVAFDGIETLNGHSTPTANRRAREIALRVEKSQAPSGAAPAASARGAKPGLALTGGSDAHTAPRVGLAWTEFPHLAPGKATAGDVLEALREGRCRPGGSSSRKLALDYQLKVAWNWLRRGLKRV